MNVNCKSGNKMLVVLLISFFLLSAFSINYKFRNTQQAAKIVTTTYKLPDTTANDSVESKFPGGDDAWNRSLGEHMRYPEKAVKKKIEGDIVVDFIIDKKGNVVNVSASSGPGELRAEAIRVVRSSPKWKPAELNGVKVDSYKKQHIKFHL